MSEDHLTNAAGRLFLLLEHTASESPKGARASHPLVHVWAEYVGIPAEESPEFYQTLTEILSMPAAARRAVESLTNSPIPLPEFLEPIDRVEQRMFMASARRITGPQFLEGLLPPDRSQLKMASYLLMKEAIPTETAKPALDRIVALAEEIRVIAVRDDSIAQPLRTLLLQLVHKLQASVDHFRIGGVDAIAANVDQIVGAGVRVGMSGEKRNRNLFGKLKELATTIVLLSGAVAAPLQIGESFMGYMDALEGDASVFTEAPAADSVTPEV